MKKSVRPFVANPPGRMPAGGSPTDLERSSSLKLADDQPRGLLGRDVLPDPDDGPAGTPKFFRDAPIALDVAGQLRPPVVGVGLGSASMLRTGVPEAPVDENRDLRPSESDVRANSAAGKVDQQVLAVSIALPMEQGTNTELRTCVAAGIRSHRGRGRRARRERVRGHLAHQDQQSRRSRAFAPAQQEVGPRRAGRGAALSQVDSTIAARVQPPRPPRAFADRVNRP